MLLNFDVLESLRFRNEFNIAVSFAAGQSFVRSEPVILIDAFEKFIHQGEHFKNELVLSEVIAVFIDEGKTATILGLKGQLKWSHG